MYDIYEKLRNERGLKDRDIARLTGISVATLSDWKNGRYTPKSDKLLKIANVLNVPLEYLMTGTSGSGKSSFAKFPYSQEALQIARAADEDPALQSLFNDILSLSKEDRQSMAALLKRLLN